MSYGRPSSAMDFVRPVIACLVAVYAALPGRGTWAEIEPLLMIRPPCGRWARIAANASRAQRKDPVRLVATVDVQSATAISSTLPDGPNVPALLTSRSTRPQRSRTAAKRLAPPAAAPPPGG